jgi:Uma2 family endonuclease
MTSLSISPPTLPQPVQRPHRFTVAEYHCMIEQGILGSESRVELLEGQVIDKITHNPPHDFTVWQIQTALLALLPAEWILRTQSAITTTDSEPEPDIVVGRGPGTRYRTAHPQPGDIGLLIEVADATLADDRTTKKRIYARSRIPVYWIVNLVDSIIEVYTQPRAGRAPTYRQERVYGVEESVPVLVGGQDLGAIPVRELLPAPSP